MTTAPTTDVRFPAAAQPAGPPIRQPRTTVAIIAALQAVALRIDEAGITADDVLHLGWETLAFGEYGQGVKVHVHGQRQFEALAALLPTLTRRENLQNDGSAHVYVEGALRDGTLVQIVTVTS